MKWNINRRLRKHGRFVRVPVPQSLIDRLCAAFPDRDSATAVRELLDAVESQESGYELHVR
jgi:CRISPR/Cas system endoribonuclease Cas6 (RAMP superfamily)